MGPLIDKEVRTLTEAGQRAYRWGFSDCLNLFAIWRDDVQRIGARETDIREIHKQLRREIEKAGCTQCQQTGMQPSHFGSERCESGSLASGGETAHCSCDTCF